MPPARSPGARTAGASADEAQRLLGDFRARARAGLSDVVLELSDLYQAALEELAYYKVEVQVQQDGETRALREEIEELKKEVERLTDASRARRAGSLSGQPPSSPRSPGTSASPAASPLPPKPAAGAVAASPSAKSITFASSTCEENQLHRFVLFLDLSPECDDECALLYLLAECNNSSIRATVDLIVPDSPVRYSWFAHLFLNKFSSGDWQLSADNSRFTMGCVTVNMFLLPSPSRQSMVEEEFKKKLGDKHKQVITSGKFLHLNPRPVEEVAEGSPRFVVVAAPIPELEPKWFRRFEAVGATYVVGTPGGVNCPSPSWSHTLFALHQLGPVSYLSPQFTREVRFPRDYVDENPHWTWYMKETVFDSALTVLARRPEMPAKFGNWGLMLRLNAANAKVCRSWYKEIMGKDLDMENQLSRFKTIVSAYVDRNSGQDRLYGNVATELKNLGVPVLAKVNEKGMPMSAEDAQVLGEAYRKELFNTVYTCVVTAETLLFSHQANYKYTGENGFPTMMPRCGYADPTESLAKIFGSEDAIEILRSLPLSALTPAYDMVGVICALQHFKAEVAQGGDEPKVQDLGLRVKAAPPEMGAQLFREADKSPHPILCIGEQTEKVVASLVNLLSVNVSSDPLLLIDEFWAKLRVSQVREVGALTHRSHNQVKSDRGVLAELEETANDFFSMGMDKSATTRCQSSSGVQDRRSVLQQYVLHPASSKQVVWATISLLLICYDMVVVPLSVFGESEIRPLTVIFTIWWSLDILHSFCLGYYSNGVVELRPLRVALKYLRTWFLLDLCIVVVDWLIVAEAAAMIANQIFFFKMLRILRVVRLLQVAKVDRIITLIEERFPSFWVDALIRITRMLVTIFSANHLVACLWYYIAAAAEGGHNWVLDAGMQEADASLLYFTSLHWAFAHLMLGEIDIAPANTAERVFSVIILICGLVVFSSFVSSMTEFTARVASETADHSRRDAEVRRFMESHGISAKLAMQVDRFRKHHVTKAKTRKTQPMEEVEDLMALPEHISILLVQEVFKNTLCSHPFFKKIVDNWADTDLPAELMQGALVERCYDKGQDIFLKGQPANTVLVLTSGRVLYIRDDVRMELLADGKWVSEPALWLGHWKRRGDLHPLGFLVVHELSIAGFRDFAERYGEIGLLGSHFAELVAHLRVSFSELHDLQVDVSSREALAVQAMALLSGETEEAAKPLSS